MRKSKMFSLLFCGDLYLFTKIDETAASLSEGFKNLIYSFKFYPKNLYFCQEEACW